MSATETHAYDFAPAGADDWRELASRENDGLAVALLWSPSADGVKVTIVDTRLDEAFELDVPGPEALAAFHHPYAFAATRGSSPASWRSGSTHLSLHG
jgi:hypothetical protein